MPRPKPTYEQLRDNFFPDVPHLRPSEDEDWKINTNYNFTALCLEDNSPDKGKLIFDVIPDVGVKHLYKISVNYIKMGKTDPKVCPYCYTEKNKKETGISFDILDSYVKKYEMEIINKKDFYSRYEDFLSVRCKKGHTFEVKSLFYREEHNYETEIVCNECTMLDEDEKIKKIRDEKGLIENDKLKTEIEKIVKIMTNESFILPDPIYNKEVTKNSLSLLKDKWHIKEYNGTREKSVFICKDCGKEKITYIGNLRDKGFKCLNCFLLKQKNAVSDKLKEVCEKYKLIPVKDFRYISVDTPIELKCNECGHIFVETWSSITGKYKIINCPNCYVSSKTISESDFYDYIKSIYGGEIIRNTKKIISPYELDVYIPEKSIAFEYCGTYWHSEANGKDKFYHRNKYRMCKEMGIRLITIFEDEWNERKEICKSRISNILDVCKISIGARECELKQIDLSDSNKFLEENHIQGRGNGSYDINYGLLYKNELVCLMSFKNIIEGEWELSRFCSKINIRINGGANKLLNYFRQCYKGVKLSTFADLRWTEGEVYNKLRFVFECENPPNCSYVGSKTGWSRVHRMTFNKKYLEEKFGCDSTRKKDDLTEELGLFKIWDCGKKKYSLIC